MNTVIATTTFSRTFDLRAQLALKTVEEAVGHGFEIVVVDGGSCQELRKGLVERGATLHDETERGMGPSRRQTMRAAWEIAAPLGSVLWMEPEKWPLLSQVFLIEAEMEKTGADIVVPKRKSMESYPALQQISEADGNMHFAKLFGIELDVWIGPRLIGPQAIRYFLDYNGGFGNGGYGDKWDSIFIPIARAIFDGLKVVGCEVDYIHPAEQTAAEEADPNMNEKRFIQLQNLVPAFYAEARKLGIIK